jgi:hypothetical protein
MRRKVTMAARVRSSHWLDASGTKGEVGIGEGRYLILKP